MKVYFGINRINELRQHYQQIAPLFNAREQTAMLMFLSEIESNGCCDIELYDNIYSILNRIDKRNNAGKKQRKVRKQSHVDQETTPDISEMLLIIELMRLKFATRYYVTNSQVEVGNEPTNNLRNN